MPELGLGVCRISTPADATPALAEQISLMNCQFCSQDNQALGQPDAANKIFDVCNAATVDKLQCADMDNDNVPDNNSGGGSGSARRNQSAGGYKLGAGSGDYSQ